MQRPVVAIVQARMGSTRLPGKVLATALGRPLLEILLARIAPARTLDATVVATSAAARDDPVAAVARAAGADVFRGSEDDVLERFRGAAQAAGAGTVVRLTADCPLLGADVVDRVVSAAREATEAWDLVTNAPPSGRTYPDGMDVEVLAADTLERLASETRAGPDREHVTAALHRPPYRVRAVHLDSDHGDLRLTVDTAEDLERVRGILAVLEPRWREFTVQEAIAVATGGPRDPA